MFTRLTVSMVVVLGAAGGLRTASGQFSLLPTFDVEIGNDAQIGPGNASETGTGMGIRNIASRRRVSYVTYDISELRSAGQMFLNVSFSNYGHDPGTVEVYGVLESVEDLVAPGINWNNAPGVKNDPTPPLDSDVVLDPADLTDVLLTFDAPARGTRTSTDTSQALADFLNSDTNGFVALMFAPQGAGNAIVRTVEMGADGGTRLEGEVGGMPTAARDPSPADGAVDVARDVILSWVPGAFAVTHDVYFGTSFDDVNAAGADLAPGVQASLDQDTNTYDPPGLLEFGQTCYWRVDEVNTAGEVPVYRGPVWSFTVEPFAYRVESIIATASSALEGTSPQSTVDGSGLNADDLHSTDSAAMWLSSKAGPEPTWIRYELDRVRRLHEIWVWNYNVMFEPLFGLGFKDVAIEYSADGTDWTSYGDAEFAQAPGEEGYAHNTVMDLSDVAARYIRLTAKSRWGAPVPPYGLSEVRFFDIPVYAREPVPVSEATDVHPDVMLAWRAGREAASHRVCFSADMQAVTDGTAPAGTVDQTSFDPGPLDLATTYYWKVSEVNEARSPDAWTGDVWSFTTQEYLVVDDFESYTDDEGSRIYESWIDGWEDPANGSQVGYAEAPFAERTTVHGGRQSMPLAYDNSAAAYSEAERTFAAPQDWTAHGVRTVSLYFYGATDSTVGQMYLKVNGVKVAYAGPADDLKQGAWLLWEVDPASFGAGLNEVATIAVGIDGAGAAGLLYLDDIRLYP